MRFTIRSGSALAALILGLAILLWSTDFFGFFAPEISRNESLNALKKAAVLNFSHLDGLVLRNLEPSEEFALGVMIDNAEAARPNQSGLEEASLVFEALAEGGVSRFLAIFSSRQELDRIGPVRSARSYFFDLFQPLHGAFVHAGGSDEVMSELWDQDAVADIDHGRFGDEVFWRDELLNRPHNLFTNSSFLKTALRSISSGGFQPLARDVFAFAANPKNIGLKIKSGTVDYPGSGYDSEWTWDSDQQAFVRSQENSAADISVQNLVFLEMQSWAIPDDEKGRIEIVTTGSGKMLLLQNGQSISGEWQRANAESRFVFSTSSGKPLTLLLGKTWVVLLDDLDRFQFLEDFSELKNEPL